MKNAIRLFAALTLAVLVSGTLFAAKAPVKKPAPKKPATTNKATMGTTQLKSDYNNPKFGETFTLGKTAPINITVHGAEYTVDQLHIGDGMFLTNADQKYLVVHYTLHNPNPRDYGLAWSTLNFQAVDANDQTWRYEQEIGIETTGEKCNMNLKPGQKVKLYAMIRVPAKGAIPKLMVESRDRLVLRYQLLQKDAKGKYVNPVKPLPAPIADPADETGGTALEKVPAELSVFYPLSTLDVKLDSIAFSDAPINGKAPKNGERYLVAIVTARNDSRGDFRYAWSSIAPKLTDQDSGEIRWNGEALFASRDENAKANIEPGQEFRVRFYFSVPQNLPLKSVTLQYGNTGRAYVYDLTNLK